MINPQARQIDTTKESQMSDEQRSDHHQEAASGDHLVDELFDVVELVTHDVELPETSVLVADSKLEACYLGLLNACGIDLDLLVDEEGATPCRFLGAHRSALLELALSNFQLALERKDGLLQSSEVVVVVAWVGQSLEEPDGAAEVVDGGTKPADGVFGGFVVAKVVRDDADGRERTASGVQGGLEGGDALLQAANAGEEKEEDEEGDKRQDFEQ